MRQSVFYSREDVECAGIIEENPHLFDFSFQLWAAKVIAWFQNFLSLIRERVTVIRARRITTPIDTIVRQTAALIKNGVLFVNPITLMA